MKPLLLILYLFLFVNNLSTQDNKNGKVIVEKFLAPSLQGNRAGEDPMRRLTIYLPPGYKGSNQRYPTIYYLHGFTVNDSFMMRWNKFNELMDTAILNGHLHPMILVLPNSETDFGGSLYTNSTLTGNWADYIGKDVVNYIDKKYRTIPDRNSRGLCGHSMGGNGALKLGMLFPDVFGAVYALSPGGISWPADSLINDPVFKGLDSFRNELSNKQIIESIMKGEPDARKNSNKKFMADLARTYSPTEDKTFLSAQMPVSYIGDSMIVNEEVVKKWEANFPINMIEGHLTALKSLNAIKMDWGRNDNVPGLVIGCLQFSKKLEANGVNHFAEQYIGGHADKQGGWAGRIYTDLLPFFDTYLKREDKARSTSK